MRVIEGCFEKEGINGKLEQRNESEQNEIKNKNKERNETKMELVKKKKKIAKGEKN